MKKLIVALGVCLVNSVCAQWAGSSGVTNPIYRTDAVGIGLTSAPTVPLVVQDPSGNGTKISFGNNGMLGSYSSSDAVLELTCPSTSNSSYLQVMSGNGSSRFGMTIVASPYGVALASTKASGGTALPLEFATHGSSGLSTKMKIELDGKVSIGSVSSLPGTYKLYVEDGILTEKVKVAIDGSGNWSDYVFAPEYKLRSLKEVDAFIKKNRHLPGVPSAEEVVASGIDVATMDAKLLEKIEELTLYIINLEKKLEVQQQQLETLKNQTNRK